MPIFTDKRSLGGLEVVLSNKRRCTAVDFPILSRPSGIEQTTAPRLTTVPRPATATIIAKENKVVNLWACNCSVLLLGKKGKPNHLAACKRQVWLNTVLQLHQEKKLFQLPICQVQQKAKSLFESVLQHIFRILCLKAVNGKNAKLSWSKIKRLNKNK